MKTGAEAIMMQFGICLSCGDIYGYVCFAEHETSDEIARIDCREGICGRSVNHSLAKQFVAPTEAKWILQLMCSHKTSVVRPE